MVYGSVEGDRDMRTTLYVHESVDADKPGWVWVCVRNESGLWGQVVSTTKSSQPSTCKADATYCGVATMASDGVDVDCVQYGWPKPVAQPDYRCQCVVVPIAPYPTEPGAPLTWQQAQARVDAGLGVETLRSERRPEEGWRKFGIGGDRVDRVGANPFEFPRWTYRVPAEPSLNISDKTIVRLAHELETEKQAHAATKTELAAAQDQLLGLKSVVDFKNRKVGALIQDIQVTGQHLATVEIENRELRAKVAVLDKIKGML